MKEFFISCAIAIGCYIVGIFIGFVCNVLNIENCSGIALAWLLLINFGIPISYGYSTQSFSRGAIAYLIIMGCSIPIGFGAIYARNRWY